MRNAPTNNDDVIDSRDVIERIEELKDERDGWVESPDHAGDDPSADLRTTYNDAWALAFPDDAAELAALEALQEEAEGYADDWKYGDSLIRDSYFTKYCEELVRDIGDIPKELPPYIADNINWQGVADDLRVDYTSVDFDGITYWVR